MKIKIEKNGKSDWDYDIIIDDVLVDILTPESFTRFNLICNLYMDTHGKGSGVFKLVEFLKGKLFWKNLDRDTKNDVIIRLSEIFYMFPDKEDNYENFYNLEGKHKYGLGWDKP